MTDILEKIKLLVAPLLEGTDIFFISVKIKPTNNVKLFLDADSGLSIEKIISINRPLHKIIEEEGLFPDGDFSLEVSSPGIDEPLIYNRQYKKNIGRTVLVTLKDDIEKKGTLKEVSDEHIVLEVAKKKEVETITIPLEDIVKTVVQISF